MKYAASFLLIITLGACQQDQIQQEAKVQQNGPKSEISQAQDQITMNAGDSAEGLRVFIEKDDNENRLILEKVGKRSVLDRGDLQIKKDGSNINTSKVFSNPVLDKNGKYILVAWTGYEFEVGDLYKIENQKIVATFPGTNRFGFTPDGNFVFGCARNEFAGEYYGKVYSLSSEEEVFDLPLAQYDLLKHLVDCSASPDNKILFTIKGWGDAGEPTKVVEQYVFPDLGFRFKVPRDFEYKANSIDGLSFELQNASLRLYGKRFMYDHQSEGLGDYAISKKMKDEIVETQSCRPLAENAERDKETRNYLPPIEFTKAHKCKVTQRGSLTVVHAVGINPGYEGLPILTGMILILKRDEGIMLTGFWEDLHSEAYKTLGNQSDIDFPSKEFNHLYRKAENHLGKEVKAPSPEVKKTLKEIEKLVNGLEDL